MPPRPEHLSSLTGPGLRWDRLDDTLECSMPHALTRAAGYMKHVRGQHGEHVLFRGQTSNWPSCIPSLFRVVTGGTLTQKIQARRSSALEDYVVSARGAGAFIRGTSYPYDFAHEPLLQQYGIATRWLDVVDNLWVALWFAVQECVPDPECRRHWHFTPSTKPFGYVLLMSPGENVRPVPKKPGLAETTRCELIDLRVAAPSLFVRPHAQHGLLLRRKTYPPRDVTLNEQIVGVIKVKTNLARRWLGKGFLHDPHVVFPPPHYDAGYSRLLGNAPEPPQDIGGIGIVFA